MRSIELTLDDEADAAVRSVWGALADAGLPSLATHAGASNRPHVTLAAGEDLADGEALRAAVRALPLELSLGGVLLFGAGRPRVVLAFQVVAASALLDLHRRVHAATPGAVESTLPGRWTPHITIAPRLPAADLPAALSLLTPLDRVLAVDARLWDGVEKTVTPLSPVE